MLLEFANKLFLYFTGSEVKISMITFGFNFIKISGGALCRLCGTQWVMIPVGNNI